MFLIAGGGGSYGWVLMQPASSRACSRTRYHSARYYLQGPLKKCPCSYMEVSLNYCSKNGGNLYRAPNYFRNLNIGPCIDSNLGQSRHRVEGLGFRVRVWSFFLYVPVVLTMTPIHPLPLKLTTPTSPNIIVCFHWGRGFDINAVYVSFFFWL